MRNKIVSLFVLVLMSFLCKGQVNGLDSISQNIEYPFINYAGDTLINAQHLAPFYKKLLALENGDTGQVSILHIGDSHIQADFITREVRKNLQLRFGNAGRGLVFPLRVAGTNEPGDYRTSSNVGWQMAKVNSANRVPEPGLSGISILSTEGGAYIDITTTNHDDLDYAFDQVTLIHTKDALQYDCRITDSITKFGYLMSAEAMEPGDCSTRVPFLHPSNFVRIQAEQTENNQNSVTLNGVILQNSLPGILYHSVGINGAHYSDYNSSPQFFRQMKMLKPDLVIISMGTNEGANTKVTMDEIIAQVTTTVQNISAVNPATCILITTPTDDYLKKKYKNPYLEAVQRAIVQSASQQGVACWDLYNITGGFGSCAEWRKAALMQRDGVHFTKTGYLVQGDLLFKALIYGYQKYAAY